MTKAGKLIRLSWKQNKVATKIVERMFKPEHKHRGLENGITMMMIKNNLAKELEGRGILDKSLKAKNNYQFNMELEQLARRCLTKLMDPREDIWFLQGLISHKQGQIAYYFFPDSDKERTNARTVYNKDIKARQKMMEIRYDIEAKQYVERLPEHGELDRLPKHENPEVQ